MIVYYEYIFENDSILHQNFTIFKDIDNHFLTLTDSSTWRNDGYYSRIIEQKQTIYRWWIDLDRYDKNDLSEESNNYIKKNLRIKKMERLNN